MRLLTLFFLPLCLWSQQIDVQWNWQGTEQIHVGDLLKRVPKAIGHTVFYDEEHQRFAISISKQLGDNPSTKSIDFVVSDKNNILINAIYNIPNPFETQTTFWVSHNKPRELIEANIIVHDINGKKVWEQSKTLYSGTNTNSEIVWNGQSNDGTLVNKGLYLCTITLNSRLSNTTHTETHRIISNK